MYNSLLFQDDTNEEPVQAPSMDVVLKDLHPLNIESPILQDQPLAVGPIQLLNQQISIHDPNPENPIPYPTNDQNNNDHSEFDNLGFSSADLDSPDDSVFLDEPIDGTSSDNVTGNASCDTTVEIEDSKNQRSCSVTSIGGIEINWQLKDDRGIVYPSTAV